MYLDTRKFEIELYVFIHEVHKSDDYEFVTQVYFYNAFVICFICLIFTQLLF